MTAQLLLEGHAPNRLTADQYLPGRDEGCDILLPEASTMASRRHARLNREASVAPFGSQQPEGRYADLPAVPRGGVLGARLFAGLHMESR